jgi:dipeptidyl aminopeptidase/acylaminoacyl peptidase
MVNRKIYFDASPMSYATVDKNTTRFLLLYGHEDDIVDPKTQSERFLLALKQAQFFARTIVVPGAGHFWSVDPVDEGFGAYAGPKVLGFLDGAL